VTSAKPSLTLLRELSDEAVLSALMDAPRLTRAELAVITRLSKPTAAEAIRRLEAAGLVRDTGERTTGRGGVGSYYALAHDVGVGLAVSVAPAGIVVECVDASGGTTARQVEPIGRPATPRTVARLLTKATRTVLADIDPREVCVAVVSAADPVDRGTGELVHLPDAPFLIGRLSPARTLAPLVGGEVLVDNDVNWAARAERDLRAADGGASLDDFVYLHLGEGLGCAVVTDGEVRRGHGGLAGEVAHVTTTGVDGRAVAFTDVFEQLGLRHPGSTAIDVDTLLARAADPELTAALAVAVCDVLSAAIAFADPQIVIIGGAWGPASPIFRAVQRRMRALSRSVPLELARGDGDGALTGVRTAAVAALRRNIVARSKTTSTAADDQAMAPPS
jgi:predicted NBD/HSP70 family sugar kinase